MAKTATRTRKGAHDQKPMTVVMQHDVAMGVSWKQNMLGSIQTSLSNFKIGPVNEDAAGTAWAEILLDGEKPEQIGVKIEHDLNDGVKLLHSTKWGGTRSIDADIGVPDMIVPVKWFKKGPFVTDRNDAEKRNICNLEFYNEYAGFMQVEISIVVRYRKLFLVIQELYAGQAALCTVAQAKADGQQYVKLDGTKLVAVVGPLWEQSAYPGASYLRTWPNVGKALVEAMQQDKCIGPLDGVEYATWNPVSFDSLGLDAPSGGRTRGWCTFFNVDSNYGFIRLENGDGVFVHFNALPHGMIALQGMEPYEFDVEPGNKPGQVTAQNVMRLR